MTAAEEREYRKKVATDERVALYRKTLTNERPDPEWSVPAERTIREAYSGSEFEGVSMTVECKTTLCRVEFAASDVEKAHEGLRALMSKHPWAGRKFTYFNQETKTGASYVAREDFELPAIDLRALIY